MIRAYPAEARRSLEAMRLLARIGIAREVLDDAELLLDGVLSSPRTIAPRATTTPGARRAPQARAARAARAATARDPDNRDYRRSAATLRSASVSTRALELYRELLADTPRPPDLHLSIAHALKTLGGASRRPSIPTARRRLPARISAMPTGASPTSRPTASRDEEIARMRAAEAAPTTAPVDRYHLCFALGKALEDRGEYAESCHTTSAAMR